jgi:hypothetical protein
MQLPGAGTFYYVLEEKLLIVVLIAPKLALTDQVDTPGIAGTEY